MEINRVAEIMHTKEHISLALNHRKTVGSSSVGFDWMDFLYIAIVLAMPILLGPAGVALSFVILLVKSLRGGANDVIEAIVLSSLIRFLNPMLVEPDMISAIGSLFVTFAGAMVVFRNPKHGALRRKSNVMWVVFFSYMFLAALVFSSARDVSYFKLVMLALLLLVLTQAIRTADFKRLERFLYNVLLFLVLASLPFLAFPAIGMARNDQGFQGILNHPQSAGSVLAVFLAYFVCLYIYARERFTKVWVTVILFVLSLFFLYKTQARTGGFAMILAISLTVAVVSLVKKFPLKRKARPAKYTILALCFGLVAVIFGMNSLQRYVFKARTENSEVTDTSIEAVYSSRVGLIGNAFYTLNDHALFGIGFGVASPGVFLDITYLPGTPIPISAPIEKGNMLVAILEEGGVIGLTLLLMVFGFLLKERVQINPVYSVTLLTPFFVNFGEYNLFTTNGLGPLMLLFLLLQPQKSSWGELK